jgi:hypothetical protein
MGVITFRFSSRTMKRGNGVSFYVPHVPLGDISLSICIWIELIMPRKMIVKLAHDDDHLVVLAPLRRQ